MCVPNLMNCMEVLPIFVFIIYGFQTEDNDGVWIFYEGGKSAFIHPFIYQNKMDINSYVTFNSVNEHGFTLTPGSFSDFILSERSFGNQIFGHTKDFLPVHFGFASLYLLNFCYNKSKRIDTLIVNNKSIYDLVHEHGIQYSSDVRGGYVTKSGIITW